MKIEVITEEKAKKYRKEIAQFYFENVQACSFFENYTYDEAFEKVGDFIDHLENGTAIAYGLFDGDELYGYVRAYPHRFREENRLYVNEIRIREGWRRKGYGKELLKLIEDKSKEMGLSAVYLHAEANNPGALMFYHNMGYDVERMQLRKEME